jgi:transposase
MVMILFKKSFRLYSFLGRHSIKLSDDITSLETVSSKAQAIGRGRPRKALHEDVQYLIRLAHHKPTLFLDEYQQRLKGYRLLSLSMATIHRELQRAGLSTKQVQKMAAEKDLSLECCFGACSGPI